METPSHLRLGGYTVPIPAAVAQSNGRLESPQHNLQPIGDHREMEGHHGRSTCVWAPRFESRVEGDGKESGRSKEMNDVLPGIRTPRCVVVKGWGIRGNRCNEVSAFSI
ncbi:hypothetical protein H2248_009012 [Termitomyces sp. 'cryptogamus']|nr:hypothetical protein H2248_009012 [Termitomyces sp. 'cryptogamus']